MRKGIGIGGGLVGLLCIVAILPGGTSARYVPMTLEERLNGKDIVVAGKKKRQWPGVALVFAGKVVSMKDKDGRSPWTLVQFEVHRVLKDKYGYIKSAITPSTAKKICSIHNFGGFDEVTFRIGDEVLLLCHAGGRLTKFHTGGGYPYTFFLKRRNGSEREVFDAAGRPISAVEKGDIVVGGSAMSSELFFKKILELIKPE